MKFTDHVVELVRAGYQLMTIDTAEEVRVETELEQAAKALDLRLVCWDAAGGWSDKGDMDDPLEAVRALSSKRFAGTICVLRDFAVYLRDPLTARTLRSQVLLNQLSNADRQGPVFLVGVNQEIPADVQAIATPVSFTLPGEPELRQVVEFTEASLSNGAPKPDDALRGRITQALRGLTSTEAENCLALCTVRHKGFAPDMLDTIETQKAALIERSECLSYVPKDVIAARGDIGGYGDLLEWLDRRAAAYEPEAQAIGLDAPKGICLIGVPGTGKSLVGKALAKLLRLPLVMFDVSSVFGSLVGASESRMRRALEVVSAIDSCVLLVDEADKALGGAVDGGGDSGVTRRVFGQFLTWLAEKRDHAFVCMTLNRTRGMPPELLRKGRFDEVWFVDLPSESERRQIVEIHLRKRNALDASQDMDRVAASTDGFVGAELEDVVKAARFAAWATRRSGVPTTDELQDAVQRTVPLSKLDKEAIDEIRNFGRTRARSVSSTQTRGTSQRRARGVAVN